MRGAPQCVKKHRLCFIENVGANIVRPPTWRSNVFSGRFLTRQTGTCAHCAPLQSTFSTLWAPSARGLSAKLTGGERLAVASQLAFIGGGRTHPPAFAACLYILIYKGKPMPTKEAIQIKTRQDPTGCAWLFFCSNIQGEQKRHRKSGKKIKKTCKKVLTKQTVVAIIMRSSARAPGARNKILPHSSVG